MSRNRSSIPTLAIFAILALFLTVDRATAAPGDPGCEFDFDGDGSVTEDDLFVCQSLLLIFPPVYDERCDTNGDGILSTLDLAAILAAIQSGVDCSAPVPIGSTFGRGLLLLALTLASVLALRFGAASPRAR